MTNRLATITWHQVIKTTTALVIGALFVYFSSWLAIPSEVKEQKEQIKILIDRDNCIMRRQDSIAALKVDKETFKEAMQLLRETREDARNTYKLILEAKLR